MIYDCSAKQTKPKHTKDIEIHIPIKKKQKPLSNIGKSTVPSRTDLLSIISFIAGIISIVSGDAMAFTLTLLFIYCDHLN